MTETKSFLQSKVFWFACIQALGGVVTAFATTYPTVGWLFTASGIVTFLLRLATDQGINLRLPS